MWAMGFEPKTKSLSIVDSHIPCNRRPPENGLLDPGFGLQMDYRRATAKTYCNTELTFRIG